MPVVVTPSLSAALENLAKAVYSLAVTPGTRRVSRAAWPVRRSLFYRFESGVH